MDVWMDGWLRVVVEGGSRCWSWGRRWLLAPRKYPVVVVLVVLEFRCERSGRGDGYVSIISRGCLGIMAGWMAGAETNGRNSTGGKWCRWVDGYSGYIYFVYIIDFSPTPLPPFRGLYSG